MKRMKLSAAEQRTLREMGVFHSHRRENTSPGIFSLNQRLTLQKTADKIGLQLNNVEQ